MLISADDDPAQLKAQVDPIITEAVARELAKRGLVPAPAGSDADMHVLYYLLISTGESSQAMGQFINTPAWGLPPISVGTTALEVYHQGSLVLDLIAVSQKSTVWRGVAQAEIIWERNHRAAPAAHPGRHPRHAREVPAEELASRPLSPSASGKRRACALPRGRSAAGLPGWSREPRRPSIARLGSRPRRPTTRFPRPYPPEPETPEFWGMMKRR